MEPVVSVITPAFNAVHRLGDCVASIRSQSFGNWEHVVVDDGSTDATWALLEELKTQDPRLRTIHQANAGPGAARNAAMKAASGSYFAFLDADDRATPHRLATQIAFLVNHPEVHVLGGAIVTVSDTGQQLGTECLPAEHEDLEKEIFRICPFFTSTVMARRAFFEQTGGFAEDLRRAQDYDWWLRGCRGFRYHNLSIPLAFYTRSKRLRWRDVRYCTRVVFTALSRERRLLRNLWYVLRPTVGYAAYRVGYKRR